jgi:hypothetical protein
MKTKALGTLVLSPCQIVAWNLERIRRERGLTQEQAAKKLEPYLGYRLSRAAFSQAERCLYGKLRRFDADEIVAFARAFQVPIPYFFGPPQPHFRGKTVVVNGKPGNPKACVTSPPLARQDMFVLAQGLPGEAVLKRIAEVVVERTRTAIVDGTFKYLEKHPDELAKLFSGRIPASFWEEVKSELETNRTATSEQRLAQAVLDQLHKSAE